MISGGRSRWLACWFAIAMALPITILCLLAFSVLSREGYSPDEEITAATVKSIDEAGLPLLPSGVLYNRGFPFPYLAWIVGKLLDDRVESYRLASLLCALVGIVAAFRLGYRLGGLGQAALLSVLLATFPAYVAMSVFARHYSALLACALVFLWLLSARAIDQRRRSALLLTLSSATLLHPIGATLAAVPMLLAAMATGPDRKKMSRLALQCAIAVGLTICASHALHAASLLATGFSVTPDTAIYAIPSLSLSASFFPGSVSWVAWLAIVTLFALLAFMLDRQFPGHRDILAVGAVAGVFFQLGSMLLLFTIGALLRPARARIWVISSTVMAGASLLSWPLAIAANTDARFSFEFAIGLTKATLWFPLAAVRQTFSALPAVGVLAVLGGAISTYRREDSGARIVRALGVSVVVLFVLYDILSIPFVERYYVLPWTFVSILASYGAAGCGVNVSRTAAIRSTIGRVVTWALPATATVWLLVGQSGYARFRQEWQLPVQNANSWLAPPTGASWTPDRLRALVDPGETLVCTEELACAYLLGGLDYLFALSPEDTAHYAVSRAGTLRGFYAGSPLINNEQDFERLLTEPEKGPCSVMVALNTGKVDFEGYRTLAAELTVRFLHRVLLTNDEAYVIRLCGSGN